MMEGAFPPLTSTRRGRRVLSQLQIIPARSPPRKLRFTDLSLLRDRHREGLTFFFLFFFFSLNQVHNGRLAATSEKRLTSMMTPEGVQMIPTVTVATITTTAAAVVTTLTPIIRSLIPTPVRTITTTTTTTTTAAAVTTTVTTTITEGEKMRGYLRHQCNLSVHLCSIPTPNRTTIQEDMRTKVIPASVDFLLLLTGELRSLCPTTTKQRTEESLTASAIVITEALHHPADTLAYSMG